MKKIILVVLAVSLLIISGCNTKKQVDSNTDNTTTESTKKQNFGDSVVLDGLDISLTGLSEKASVNKEGKHQKLYIFDVSATNVVQDVKGFGAIDFVAETEKNKEYTVDTETAAFGGEIKPSETVKGKVYFSIPTDKKISALKYKPAEKTLKTWKIK
ncbi:DUF4352 domain-containing protein [Enterococcus faecalis]|uniref:DUF4352 domain-containing protein n=1 Tax=Enterococcus faecalis TaxID=1351 RepID=UPI0025B23828|nr:DUF4352 domain-containing protein [Enterococcus faecalis]MDN3185219.1 DUF4352 domain-containing protein [Enterococcus faecalis]